MHSYAATLPSAGPRLRRQALHLVIALCLWIACATLALAQSTGALTGSVTDNKGGLIPRATVTVRSLATGKTTVVSADSAGHFTSPALLAGAYNVEASAPGFTQFSLKAVNVPGEVTLQLQIGSATSEITVDADATHSEAAALAPMDALLSETSARTEITSAFIQNFTSPVADYGEAVQMAPATFTLNGNGIGLGQSKTYFRGFPDGFYDIKFDGIPWSDTNSVSHHSWAFFPSQFLGGIDFDRSPGTASTIGYAPFGGSINLLSKDMSPRQNIRATFAGGSFNTYLYDVQYDSGPFGPGHKMNVDADVHHMQSHGYQTGNNQTRNAGALKFVYAPSNTFTITGFSGVIWLDANTPNFNATRCQMYGYSSAANGYTCNGTLAPFQGSGINFLLTNNADPELYLDQQYNFYHVPTDFEYIGVHKEFAHGFTLDVKPYTYNYDNSEKYSNAVPITDNMALLGTTYAPLGVKVTALCNQLVVSKGIAAEPCSVDKYNSYRTYGETSQLSQVSKFGILRAGVWYSWNNTNRHQYPTDPLNGYKNQLLPNFAEKFVQNNTEPFVEYQYHATSRLDFTPGVKFSYFTIGTQQFADNGKTIGCFQTAGCNPNTNPNINPNQFISNGGNYFATLPSASLNYRIKSNWSAYVQAAQGSIVPPSNVFDFQQGTSGTAIPPQVLPKQQKNTTYQAGTVIKLKRVTFDADVFRIHFDNSYTSTTNLANGEPIFFLQPSSTTTGLEGESNIYIYKGLSVYLNASYDKATYQGKLNVSCTTGTAGCTSTTPQITVLAPSGLNVQQTPSDIETEAVTYQHKNYDFGFFNKRVGTYYIDNGNSTFLYHNQATINPFTTSNLYFNYTIRSSGRFDNTKFRVSFNNIFNDHNITGDSIKGTANTINLSANGTTYVDPFNTNGQTAVNGGDAISILPARSVMFSVTFGLSPKGR